MTEPRAMEPFETRLAGRLRAYTDPVTERPIDPLAVSRAAMSTQRALGWGQGAPRGGSVGRRLDDARWAVALVTVALIGVVGVAVLGRLSDSHVGPQSTPTTSTTPAPTASAGGPIPDVLRHAWQRPLPITPGLDEWGTGFLSLTGSPFDFGTEPGAGASRAAIVAGGPDSLVVTATAETQGCTVGAVGTYRWSLDGKDTIMDLAPIGADACPAREKALAGRWVRADLAPPSGGGVALGSGTYATTVFDPVGDPGTPIRLSYTVPEGWEVIEDSPATFVLHHLPDAAQGTASTEAFVSVLTRPRMAALPPDGYPCGPLGQAPGGGTGPGDLVAAIAARPGVVSTPPRAVTIGGHEGLLIDLELAASWTGGCAAPEGHIVGVPLLVEAGSVAGPMVAIAPDHPVRLIVLDLVAGRTIAIVIYDLGAASAQFDAHVADAMPIVESFEIHPPAP